MNPAGRSKAFDMKIDTNSNGARDEVEMTHISPHDIKYVENEPLMGKKTPTKRARGANTFEEIIEICEANQQEVADKSAEARGLKKKERLNPFRDGKHKYLVRSFKELFFGSRLNVLMFAIPGACIASAIRMPSVSIFVLSLLGIAPLAERLGYVTEQLSMYTGHTVGGLLNATFGNATEILISIFALKSGLVRVVQLSLLGSILSNMLLVLGCAFLVGGCRYQTQKFNKDIAVVSSGLLLMATMGLLLPAVLHATHTEVVDGKSELSLSRFSAFIMLGAYAIFLYFQLHSHRELYDGDGEDDDDDDEEPAVLGAWGSIFWLAVITVFISLLSEFLVDEIEEASHKLGIPMAFISVIILPIVGNAAEHASAVMFAVKDKLDISLGVAIGSSTQISMFAIPLCVVVGMVIGEDMDLNFHIFETTTLFITVLVVAFMVQEGSATYFKGLMLVLCYLIVAASFYVHSDPSEKPANEARPKPTIP
jgi:Ca2+:H+ antiporter